MIRVASIHAKDDPSRAIRRGLEICDGARTSLRGARVLIKANFNSPHRYPASSDPSFIVALAAALKEAGAAELGLGDSCGLRWAPAHDVFEALGVPALAELIGAVPINFDEGDHRTVHLDTAHVESIRVAEAAFTWDVIVYAACMKTHRAARFSMGLKHTVGFLCPDDRRRLHDDLIEQRVVEINQAVTPTLIFLDARKCFVSGGPARGWVRRPQRILASTDRVAIDVEGLRLLSSYTAFNRLLRDPWQHDQIRTAVALGIGVQSDDDIEVFRG